MKAVARSLVVALLALLLGTGAPACLALWWRFEPYNPATEPPMLLLDLEGASGEYYDKKTFEAGGYGVGGRKPSFGFGRRTILIEPGTDVFLAPKAGAPVAMRIGARTLAVIYEDSDTAKETPGYVPVLLVHAKELEFRLGEWRRTIGFDDPKIGRAVPKLSTLRVTGGPQVWQEWNHVAWVKAERTRDATWVKKTPAWEHRLEIRSTLLGRVSDRPDGVSGFVPYREVRLATAHTGGRDCLDKAIVFVKALDEANVPLWSLKLEFGRFLLNQTQKRGESFGLESSPIFGPSPTYTKLERWAPDKVEISEVVCE